MATLSPATGPRALHHDALTVNSTVRPPGSAHGRALDLVRNLFSDGSYLTVAWYRARVGIGLGHKRSAMSQKRVAIWALTAGLVAGGGAGAILGMTRLASADTSTTTPGHSTPGAPAAGAPQSNEDATHEAGESAAREADEAAGKSGFGHHHGGSNEDATHEASESAAREAAEDAGQPAATPSAPAAAAAANA